MKRMFFLAALILFFGITFLLGWIAFRPRETERADDTLDTDLIRENQANSATPDTSRKLFFKALIRQAYRLTGKSK
jgi:cbb3-type cytochrome oxidase subunit 3